MARISTSTPASQTQTARSSKSTLPPLWRSDARPDPSVLSQDERLREFGKIMLRAIERKSAETVNPRRINDAT